MALRIFIITVGSEWVLKITFKRGKFATLSIAVACVLQHCLDRYFDFVLAGPLGEAVTPGGHRVHFIEAGQTFEVSIQVHWTITRPSNCVEIVVNRLAILPVVAQVDTGHLFLQMRLFEQLLIRHGQIFGIGHPEPVRVRKLAKFSEATALFFPGLKFLQGEFFILSFLVFFDLLVCCSLEVGVHGLLMGHDSCYFSLREQALQQEFAHGVHIEGEAVGARVLAWISITDTAVLGSDRKSYTTGEHLVEYIPVRKHHSVLAINIKLSVGDLLAQY